MQERKLWKTILTYTAGSLILAVTIILAWFMPEWYADWQDERQAGQVHLSSREDIHFLDVASLDIAGRMKLLSESDIWEYISYDMLPLNANEKLSDAKENVNLWIQNGLLPEWVAGMIAEENLMDFRTYGLHLGSNIVLPLCLIRFYVSEDYVTLIMDAEKDILYYASISGAGENVLQYIVRCLGFHSVQELTDVLGRYVSAVQEEFQSQEEFLQYLEDIGSEELRDISQYDFAAVCGAKSAVVTERPGWLELDVDLIFDSFTGYAGRRIVSCDMSPGLAVSFGGEADRWFVELLTEEEGIPEYISSIDELLDINETEMQEENAGNYF